MTFWILFCLFKYSVILIKSKFYICDKVFDSGVECKSMECLEILIALNNPFTPFKK